MKKLISLLLITLNLFLLIGCASEDTGETEDTQKVYENKAFDTISASKQISYRSFDELSRDADDIVKATYEGMVTSKGYYLLDFKAYDTLRGDIGNEIITLHYQPMNVTTLSADGVISYSTKDIIYEAGKDYLLFIKRSNTVYTEGYYFEPIEESLVVPIGNNASNWLQVSKIYGRSLSEHIESESIKKAVGEVFFEKIKETKPDYISSSGGYKTIIIPQKSDVVANAPYLLSVEIEEMEEIPRIYYRSLCKCRVISSEKGSLGGIIEVYLPTEKVEVGKKYIIAIKEATEPIDDIGYYVPTTKNSVYEAQ